MDLNNQAIRLFRMKQSSALTEEIKVLVSLAGPVIITYFLQVAMGIIDVVMSGRASVYDLAGVSVGVAFWVPVCVVPIGILMALTPMIARVSGNDCKELTVGLVYQAFWVAAAAIVILELIFINISFFIKWVDVEADIRPIATGYLHAVSFGIPALLGFNVLRSYADGLSLTRPAMIASVVGLVINIPLNYIFIYGKLGFPAMGGVGCGWATAVALWVNFIIMVGYILFTQSFKHIPIFKRIYRPDKRQIFDLLRLGVPIGFSYLAESIAFSIIALILASYGAEIVASHQIVFSVACLLIIVPLSCGHALTIRIGTLLGRNMPVEARYSAAVGLGIVLVFSLCVSTIFLFSGGFVISIYSSDIIVKELAEELVICVVIYHIADAAQIGGIGALRGYKDTKIPMLINVLAFSLLSLPLGYIIVLTGIFTASSAAKGFWVGLIIGTFVAAAAIINRLHRLSVTEVRLFHVSKRAHSFGENEG